MDCGDGRLRACGRSRTSHAAQRVLPGAQRLPGALRSSIQFPDASPSRRLNASSHASTLSGIGKDRDRLVIRSWRWGLAARFACGLAGLTALTACEPVEEIRDLIFPPDASPRERYAIALEQAGLAETALARQWAAAGDSAVLLAPVVPLPYRETGWLPPERPTALGYRLTVQRGQRVTVSGSIDDGGPLLVFLDVLEPPADSLSPPDPVTHADSGSMRLEWEPRRSGDYLLRLQPELLKGGRYTITITVDPVLAFPVSGHGLRDVGSIFGDPRDAGARSHHGIDIFAPRGTPVVAAASGYVRRVRETPRGGRTVWIRDDERGANYYYAHLDSQLVASGQRVSAGDTVGLVGNTGNARTTPPHLHFGVYSRGPTDPLPWVRPLSRRLPDLRVAQSVIGDWTRAASDGARLRAAPSDDAPVLAELPRHTLMAVVAGSGEWLRVRLPDGRAGFIAGSITEAAERPLDRRVLAAAAPIRALPSPIGAVMDSVSAGTVDVLGRFGEYLMVRSPESTGWLAPGD